MSEYPAGITGSQTLPHLRDLDISPFRFLTPLPSIRDLGIWQCGKDMLFEPRLQDAPNTQTGPMLGHDFAPTHLNGSLNECHPGPDGASVEHEVTRKTPVVSGLTESLTPQPLIMEYSWTIDTPSNSLEIANFKNSDQFYGAGPHPYATFLTHITPSDMIDNTIQPTKPLPTAVSTWPSSVGTRLSSESSVVLDREGSSTDKTSLGNGGYERR
jgi:hypothetical protein